jgi:exosortase/archaeosortase family protein
MADLLGLSPLVEPWDIKNTNSETPINRIISKLSSLLEDRFIRFSVRFVLSLIVLMGAYRFYLWSTAQQEDLDWITYQVSFLSHKLALLLGVANCEFNCFMDGCRIGVEGKMINVLEGCNGIKLGFVYIAYLIGVNHNYRSTIIQAVIGIVMIQFFNVFRIGMLVALRDLGGDAYFYLNTSLVFSSTYQL